MPLAWLSPPPAHLPAFLTRRGDGTNLGEKLNPAWAQVCVSSKRKRSAAGPSCGISAGAGVVLQGAQWGGEGSSSPSLVLFWSPFCSSEALLKGLLLHHLAGWLNTLSPSIRAVLNVVFPHPSAWRSLGPLGKILPQLALHAVAGGWFRN